MLLIVCVGMSKAGNEKKMHILKKKKRKEGKKWEKIQIHTYTVRESETQLLSTKK